jgi:hypothetical protein
MEIEEKSFRTREKKNEKKEYKKLGKNLNETPQKIQKKKFHFNHKWHCFHVWLLHVGIKCSTIINNCHNKQYMHVTHTIGVSFGNSKPLQTWC